MWKKAEARDHLFPKRGASWRLPSTWDGPCVEVKILAFCDYSSAVAAEIETTTSYFPEDPGDVSSAHTWYIAKII